jgi:hypothetical protein
LTPHHRRRHHPPLVLGREQRRAAFVVLIVSVDRCDQRSSVEDQRNGSGANSSRLARSDKSPRLGRVLAVFWLKRDTQRTTEFRSHS